MSAEVAPRPAWCSASGTVGDKAEPPEGKKQKGAGGTKGQKGSDDKIISIIAKLVMANTRELADMSAVCYLRYLMDAGQGMIAAGAAAGKAINDESRHFARKAKQESR